jgi:hypothetical protein
MSRKRASTPTFTTRLGVYNGGVFAKGNDKDTGVVGTTESRNGSANQAIVWMQWQDPMEEYVSIATFHQPLECTPNKSIRSNSNVQGRVHDEGRDDRQNPAATRSSLRTPPPRSSERHTSTASSFFSSSILTSICGYFGPVSLFSPSEDTDLATKKKHVRFSFIKNDETQSARRLSFLLDGEEVPDKPKHRRSLARMSMKDILFELDINDFSLETPTDVPTFIVFERKKRKRSSRRRYASQLFFSPQQSRRRPSNNMRLNQSF